MKIGDTFKHKGFQYKVTEVLNGGRIVKGSADVKIKSTDVEGNEITTTRKKPISIQVSDIDHK